MALFMAYQIYLNYFTFFYFQIQTVKTTMTRICRFYHNVPKNEDKCSEGHYLCCTLDCSARGCKFVTRPLHMTSFDHALKIMELHMNGAHSDLTTNKLTSEDENIKMKKKEADESTKKKKEDDDRKKLMILVTNLPVPFASKCSVARRMSKDIMILNTREKED